MARECEKKNYELQVRLGKRNIVTTTAVRSLLWAVGRSAGSNACYGLWADQLVATPAMGCGQVTW